MACGADACAVLRCIERIGATAGRALVITHFINIALVALLFQARSHQKLRVTAFLATPRAAIRAFYIPVALVADARIRCFVKYESWGTLTLCSLLVRKHVIWTIYAFCLILRGIIQIRRIAALDTCSKKIILNRVLVIMSRFAFASIRAIRNEVRLFTGTVCSFSVGFHIRFTGFKCLLFIIFIHYCLDMYNIIMCLPIAVNPIHSSESTTTRHYQVQQSYLLLLYLLNSMYT